MRELTPGFQNFCREEVAGGAEEGAVTLLGAPTFVKILDHAVEDGQHAQPSKLDTDKLKMYAYCCPPEKTTTLNLLLQNAGALTKPRPKKDAKHGKAVSEAIGMFQV